ncbi:DNA replication initiation factor cdc45 [Coemansia sp. RSA 2320]|nr:DNA replication initiation factor cdc45 [Coemansia sp. RSA 2320]
MVSLRDNLSVVIIDSHRPYNLYNVYWNEQVQCLDDGDVDKNMGELREAFENIEFGSASDEEDEGDDGDSGSDDTDGEMGEKRGATGGPKHEQRRKKKRKTGMDPDEFIRLQEQRALKREQRQHHQRLVQAYYAQGSYYGQSCAVSVLMLAEQLGLPATVDTVWWAIVGATSQYVLQHIDANGYTLVVARMHDLARRVTVGAPGPTPDARNASRRSVAGNARNLPSSSSSSLSSSQQQQGMLDSQLAVPGAEPAFNPYVDVVDEEDDEGYLKARAGVATSAEAGLLTSTKSVAQQEGISEASELKFTLLRHWTLDSAMRFSPFVATRLATWTAQGRMRLDLLVAKLGLSKAEAGAPFVHLAPELKTQLYRRMAEIGSDYDMGDATYSGFVRNYGWRKSCVSGGDMVQALLALLQQQAGAGDGDVAGAAERGFYEAYDALAQFPVLRRGIEGALELQRLIVGQGIAMLDRKAVKTLRSFRLVMMDLGGDAVAAAAFSGAFVLRQLALFLMQTLRERSKPAHARLPFVVVAPLLSSSAAAAGEVEERLLVLGITAADHGLAQAQIAGAAFNGSQFAGESRNQFGLVFEAVAADIGANIKQGFFDSTVLEIRRADLAAFVDKLRRHL